MSRNSLYLIIGVLLVIVLALGYAYQRETSDDARLSIGTDDGGISVEVDD